MKNNDVPISPKQEKFIIEALANVRKLIVYKLGTLYRDSVEDLSQRVFFKVWSWKRKNERDLNYEEWQKFINVTVQREIADFFTEKYRKDLLFSQFETPIEADSIHINQPDQQLEGNTEIEIASLLKLIWQAAQNLTLRQRYAFILSNSELMLWLVTAQCCTTKELAGFLELEIAEARQLFDVFPLSDERITLMLENKLKEPVSREQLWDARTKAKTKLINFFKHCF